MLGIDYSGTPPSPAAIKAAGYSFVVRYLSNPGNSKNLTARESAALLGAGIDIGLVWESTAGRAGGGVNAGRSDGAAAAAMARGLGAPPHTAIYYAVDFDAPPTVMPAIAAYLAGAAETSVPYPVGVYGGYPVVAAMAGRAACRYFWQTGAWSGGRRFAGGHLYQRIQQARVGGTSCDVNEALAPDWGGWLNTTGDNDMTPEEHDTLQQAHDAIARMEKSWGPRIEKIDGIDLRVIDLENKASGK